MSAQIFNIKTGQRQLHLELDPSERVLVPAVGICEHMSSDNDDIKAMNQIRLQIGSVFQYFAQSLVHVGFHSDIQKLEISRMLAITMETVIATMLHSRGYDHQFLPFMKEHEAVLADRMEKGELSTMRKDDFNAEADEHEVDPDPDNDPPEAA